MKTLVINSMEGSNAEAADIIDNEIAHGDSRQILWYSSIGHDLDVMGAEITSLRRRLAAHDGIQASVKALEGRIQELEKKIYTMLLEKRK